MKGGGKKNAEGRARRERRRGNSGGDSGSALFLRAARRASALTRPALVPLHPPLATSYPHALYFLDLLQRPDFRAAIADPSYKNLVHTQQLYFWQHWRTNQEIERAKERKEGEEAGRA